MGKNQQCKYNVFTFFSSISKRGSCRLTLVNSFVVVVSYEPLRLVQILLYCNVTLRNSSLYE